MHFYCFAHLCRKANDMITRYYFFAGLPLVLLCFIRHVYEVIGVESHAADCRASNVILRRSHC